MKTTLYTFENKPMVLDGNRKKVSKIKGGLDLGAGCGDQVSPKNLHHIHRQSSWVQPLSRPPPWRNSRLERENREARRQLRPDVPLAPFGMIYTPVRLELYLEEIVDRPLETDEYTQTDCWLNADEIGVLDVCAPFVPDKTGQDAETQVMKGDLFDFDIEVRPVLEVLIGKTVEQALLEVAEEEELASIRQRLAAFQELVNADLAELQRLEYQNSRINEEKARRLEEAALRHQEEIETAYKIAVNAFAARYCQDLEVVVFGNLSKYGYFFDAVERDVHSCFMTDYLMKEVDQGLKNFHLSQALLEEIICKAVESRKATYADMERTKAEWKLVDQTIDPIYERASRITVEDMELLIERVFLMAVDATEKLALSFSQTGLTKAIEQYCTEEAAARLASLKASSEEEEEDG